MLATRRADTGNFQRRMRYYTSLVTADRTRPGTPFADVPDVCVALVCEFDPLGERRPLYHASRVVRESGRAFENGLEEVYVSALARGGSDVSALRGSSSRAGHTMMGASRRRRG